MILKYNDNLKLFYLHFALQLFHQIGRYSLYSSGMDHSHNLLGKPSFKRIVMQLTYPTDL